MGKPQVVHQGRHSHAAVAAEDHNLHGHAIAFDEAFTDGAEAVQMTWQIN